MIAAANSVEIMGGASDGAIVFPCFSLDLLALRSAFEHVDSMSWCPQGFAAGRDGPHVSVEGTYRGHEVWLRVLAIPPDDEPAERLEVPGRE